MTCEHSDGVKFCQICAEADLAELRAALYKLVQIASSRNDWKQSTWKFIEECSKLAGDK